MASIRGPGGPRQGLPPLQRPEPVLRIASCGLECSKRTENDRRVPRGLWPLAARRLVHCRIAARRAPPAPGARAAVARPLTGATCFPGPT
jgi:hypothetical protein